MEPTDDVTDDPVTGPAIDHPEPTDDPPVGTGLTKASTVLAWLALPLLVASAVLFLLPVSSPGVQHCGSPAVFLLKATSDKPLFDTSGKPLNGWNTKELHRAHDHRCSVLVSHRAVPAGALLVAFWVVALAATLLSWATRRSLRIRFRQAQRNAAYEAAESKPID
jgi:hypothetical protein